MQPSHPSISKAKIYNLHGEILKPKCILCTKNYTQPIQYLVIQACMQFWSSSLDNTSMVRRWVFYHVPHGIVLLEDAFHRQGGRIARKVFSPNFPFSTENSSNNPSYQLLMRIKCLRTPKNEYLQPPRAWDKKTHHQRYASMTDLNNVCNRPIITVQHPRNMNYRALYSEQASAGGGREVAPTSGVAMGSLHLHKSCVPPGATPPPR